MKFPLVPFLAVAALAAASGASNAAAPTPPTFAVNATHGFAVRTPSVRGAGQGLLVSGDVCRTSQIAMRPVAVRLERLGAQGEVLSSQTTPLSGALSPRSRGCAFYSIRTNWRVGADETVRITTLSAPELPR